MFRIAIFGRVTLCISLLFACVNGEFGCGRIAVPGFESREVLRMSDGGSWVCGEVCVSE